MKQIGSVGTSTPFHSPEGAPFTLFYDAESFSTGAVGVAIVDEPSTSAVTVDYAGLQMLGNVQQVTRWVRSFPSIDTAHSELLLEQLQGQYRSDSV